MINSSMEMQVFKHVHSRFQLRRCFTGCLPAFYRQDLNKDLQDFVQEERQVTNGLSEDMRILIGRVETVADVHTSWVWTYHRGYRRSVHCVGPFCRQNEEAQDLGS